MTPALLQTALAHHRAGNFIEAEKIYRQILATNPRDPDALHLLGVLAAGAGQHAQAVALFQQAIAVHPQYPAAFTNLAISLQQLGRSDEAVLAMRRSLELRPNDANALNNFGNMLKERGDLDGAIAACRKAVEINPDYAPAWHNLIYTEPFHPKFSPHDVLAEARRWAQRIESQVKARGDHPNDRDPERKLRIGYLSPDFRGHVVGWNLLPILKHHDRENFEVFCYASVARPDGLTPILRSHSRHWRDILNLSDDQAADLITSDAIDILIDLTSHMAGTRLEIFARKPAPVQVTYLGCCGTTGLSAMDFRLTDPHLDSPDSDLSCYCETTMLLPHSFWCYEPGPTPEVSHPADRPITFGCLNTFAKISPAALDLWIRILKQIHGSKLLLHAPEGNVRQPIRDRLRAGEIEPSRVNFVPMQPRTEYLQTYHRIDIALDPFPYGGGITSLDTLWMGVPLISLRGPTAVGRLGASILTNAGLSSLIAETPEQYLKLAVDLAHNPARRRELRQHLRPMMSASPLMNGPQFARDLESAYRKMWFRWRENCQNAPLPSSPR